MATADVSEAVRSNSRRLLELKAQIEKMQVSQGALEALLNQMVILPKDLLLDIEDFIRRNRKLGFSTIEGFLSDAVRFRLAWLKEDNQCFEISRDEFDRLEAAVREMGTPFASAEDFINSQIAQLLEKYQEYKNSR